MAIIDELNERYEDVGVKFQGGYGEVHVLLDRLLDRKVAFKKVMDAAHTAQLQSEIAAISGISSRHVVGVYDLVFDRSGGIVGIIEEYLSGSDLTDFCKTNSEPDRYLKLLYQLACAIADIHQHNIVHRDLKLSNVKFDEEGVVKVFDFGISCIHEAHETTTSRGTVGFAAPELYSPPILIEKSLDVYAFGVCCWLLATDVLPDPLRERPPLKSGPPPSFSTITTLPASVVGILDATLASNPAARPTMSLVRDALKAQLLFGKHRAWIAGGERITAPHQSVTVGSGQLGQIQISYDGIVFKVSAISGDVFINNDTVRIGDVVPGSCVITLGASHLGMYRSFVQFHVSHPEIVL